jgi:O-antigen/teichoic acid export membrane protein
MTPSWDKIKKVSARFKGLTEIGIANISTSIISGLFWLYMARLLGTTHYGEISYLIAVASIGVTFSYLGAGNALLVYGAKGVKIQPSVYFIALVASAIVSIILFFIFYNIAISLFVFGNVIFGLAYSDLLGRKAYKDYLKYFIAQRIMMVVFAITLYHVMGPNGVILGMALSFFPFLIQSYKVFRESKIDFSMIKSRFNFIINSYLLDIARTFSTTTDKLIIAPLFGFVLLGNYQLGVQFLSLIGILPGIVYQYILPHDASGNPNKKLKNLTIIMSVALVILTIALSPILIPPLFPKFTEAIKVIQIMSLGIIPIAISNTYISKFLSLEKSRTVLVGSGIFLAVQITLIILLGKIFGINGVAISFVLSQASETAYLIIIDRYSMKKA